MSAVGKNLGLPHNNSANYYEHHPPRKPVPSTGPNGSTFGSADAAEEQTSSNKGIFDIQA